MENNSHPSLPFKEGEKPRYRVLVCSKLTKPDIKNKTYNMWIENEINGDGEKVCHEGNRISALNDKNYSLDEKGNSDQQNYYIKITT